MNNFIVYDLETTGKDERNFIQAIQIGSILLDHNLNELDVHNISCRPLPWTLVTPDSILINRKLNVFDEDLNHYEFIKALYNKWTNWVSTNNAIFVTYNGMFFDEEILRRQFYWNLFNPYFTNTNGNSRLDLLPKMYVIAKFYSDLITIPTIDGKQNFKLENFAKSLKIDTTDAHDALADCYFLKALLDKISKSVPNYYNEIVATTSKQDFISSLQNHSIHFLVTRYGNFFPYVCLNPVVGASKLILFNLNHDPDLINQLSYQGLEKLINSSNTPIKMVSPSKSLSSICLNTVIEDNIHIENLDIFQERARSLQSMQGLLEKIIDIDLTKDPTAYSCEHPEERIYTDGFPNQILKNKFENFHATTTATEMIDLVNKIDDFKYKTFAKRICALQYPNEVPQEYLHECKTLIHERFCTDGPWPNAKENLNRTKALLEKEINEENIKILNIVQKNIEQNI